MLRQVSWTDHRERMTRPTPTWIAEQRVVLVHPDGRRVPGRIAVGQPYVADGGESRCPVEIDGFDWGNVPIAGESTLQALLLGVQFLGTTLHDFISRGGRVLDPEDDDSDVPLEALFGPLLRSPQGSRD